MDSLTSRQAADLLAVNVQKFHRLTVAHDIVPIIEAPGLRGAKFWNLSDIETLRDNLSEQVA